MRKYSLFFSLHIFMQIVIVGIEINTNLLI